MMDLIKVGMADAKVLRHPSALTTLGLGSCVGICLYDKKTKVIGMAHIMLPSSKLMKNNTNIDKFADTGLIHIINDMEKLGANRKDMVAKIAGGAQMFSGLTSGSIMQIGKRNAESVKNLLKQLKIPIISDDTGGNFGRTIEFYSDTGKLIVKTIGHGVKEI